MAQRRNTKGRECLLPSRVSVAAALCSLAPAAAERAEQRPSRQRGSGDGLRGIPFIFLKRSVMPEAADSLPSALRYAVTLHSAAILVFSWLLGRAVSPHLLFCSVAVTL